MHFLLLLGILQSACSLIKSGKYLVVEDFVIGHEDEEVALPVPVDVLTREITESIVVLSLSCENGELRLGSVDSVPDISPFFRSAFTFYFRGPIDLFKRSLDGLSYRGAKDWYGADDVSVSFFTFDAFNPDSLDFQLIAGLKIPVSIYPVNDVPYIVYEGIYFETNEDEAISLAGVHFVDDDLNLDELFVLRVVPTDGFVAASVNLNDYRKATGGESNYGSMYEKVGSLPILNATMSHLWYLPFKNINGFSSNISALNISLCGYAPDSAFVTLVLDWMHIPVVVYPVNDPLILTATAELLHVQCNRSVPISFVIIEDADASDDISTFYHARIEATYGNLYLPTTHKGEVTVSSIEPQHISFKGRLMHVNRALMSIEYSLNKVAEDSVVITVYDLGINDDNWTVWSSLSIPVSLDECIETPEISMVQEVILLQPKDSFKLFDIFVVSTPNLYSSKELFSISFECSLGSFSIERSSPTNQAYASFLMSDNQKVTFNAPMSVISSFLMKIKYEVGPNVNQVDAVRAAIFRKTNNEFHLIQNLELFVRIIPLSENPISIVQSGIQLMAGDSVKIGSIVNISFSNNELNSLLTSLTVKCAFGIFDSFNAEESNRHQSDTIKLSDDLNLVNLYSRADIVYTAQKVGVDFITIFAEGAEQTFVQTFSVTVLHPNTQLLDIKMERNVSFVSDNFSSEIPLSIVYPFSINQLDRSFHAIVNVSASVGFLTFESSTETSSFSYGDRSENHSKISFEGSISDAETALQSIHYFPLPNWNSVSQGMVYLNCSVKIASVTLPDSWNIAKEFPLFVEPTCTQATLIVPSNISVPVNDSFALSSLYIHDYDRESKGVVSDLTMHIETPAIGRLHIEKLHGLSVIEESFAADFMRIRGSINALNAALASTKVEIFREIKEANLTITLQQEFKSRCKHLKGANESAESISKTVPIKSVKNPKFGLVGPSLLYAVEDVSSLLSAIEAFGLPDITYGVVINVTYGELACSNRNIIIFESESECVQKSAFEYFISGTIAEINDALKNLSYLSRPDFNSVEFGFDSLEAVMIDSPCSFTSGKQIYIPIYVEAVNDPPKIDLKSPNISILQSESFLLKDLVVISDSEEGNRSCNNFELSLEIQNGTFHSGRLKYAMLLSPDKKRIDMTGTLFNLNEMISAIAYFGSNNSAEIDQLKILLRDCEVQNEESSIDITSELVILIDKSASEAQSYLSCPMESITLHEDVAFDFSGIGKWLKNFDHSVYLLNISASTGRIAPAINDITVDLKENRLTRYASIQNGTSLFMVGTLHELSQAFLQLQYHPTKDFNGFVEISVSVSDANTWLMIEECIIIIYFIPVNDAPNIIFEPDTATFYVERDSALPLSMMKVVDPDVPEDSLFFQCMETAFYEGAVDSYTMELSAKQGVISASSILPLTQQLLFPEQTPYLLNGTLHYINWMLISMSYVPNSCYVGSDVIYIRVSDSGHCGFGEEKFFVGELHVSVAISEKPLSILVDGAVRSEVQMTSLENETVSMPNISIEECNSELVDLKLHVQNCYLAYSDFASTSDVRISANTNTLNFTGTVFSAVQLLQSIKISPDSKNLWTEIELNLHFGQLPTALATVGISICRTGSDAEVNLKIILSILKINYPPTIHYSLKEIVMEPHIPFNFSDLYISDIDLTNSSTDSHYVNVTLTAQSASIYVYIDSFRAAQYGLRDMHPASNAVNLFGNLFSINRILPTLNLKISKENMDGNSTLAIRVCDNGFLGLGGAMTAESIVPIEFSHEVHSFLQRDPLKLNDYFTTFEDAPASIPSIVDKLSDCWIAGSESQVHVEVLYGWILLPCTNLPDIRFFDAAGILQEMHSSTATQNCSSTFKLNSLMLNNKIQEFTVVSKNHTSLAQYLNQLLYIPKENFNSKINGYDSATITNALCSLDFIIEVRPINDPPSIQFEPIYEWLNIVASGEVVPFVGLSISDIESEMQLEFNSIELPLLLRAEVELGALEFGNDRKLFTSKSTIDHGFSQLERTQTLELKSSLLHLNHSLQKLYYYPPVENAALQPILQAVQKICVIKVVKKVYHLIFKNMPDGAHELLGISIDCEPFFAEASRSSDTETTNIAISDQHRNATVFISALDSDTYVQQEILKAIKKCVLYVQEGMNKSSTNIMIPAVSIYSNNHSIESSTLRRRIDITSSPVDINMILIFNNSTPQETAELLLDEALSSDPTGIPFYLKFGHHVSSALYFDSTELEVKLHLEDLESIGNISVSSIIDHSWNVHTWMVTFLIDGDPPHLGPQPKIEVIVPSQCKTLFGYSEHITIGSAPNDTFTLTVDDLSGGLDTMSLPIYYTSAKKEICLIVLPSSNLMQVETGTSNTFPSCFVDCGEFSGQIEVSLKSSVQGELFHLSPNSKSVNVRFLKVRDSNESKMVITGLSSAVNSSLQDILFFSPNNYTGLIYVELEVNVRCNEWSSNCFGNHIPSSKGEIQIFVSGSVPLPKLTVPSRFNVLGERPSLLRGIGVDEVHSNYSHYNVALEASVGHGKIFFESEQFKKSSLLTDKASVTASLSTVGYHLKTLIYVPPTNPDTDDELIISISDPHSIISDDSGALRKVQKSSVITILPLVPSMAIEFPKSAPRYWIVDEDNTLLFASGLRIHDNNNRVENEKYLLSISATRGSFLSNDDVYHSRINVEGSIEYVNAVISTGFWYRCCSNCHGFDSISMIAKSYNTNSYNSFEVSIFVAPVNDEPKIFQNPPIDNESFRVQEIASIPFKVIDVDSAQFDTFKVEVMGRRKVDFISVQHQQTFPSSLLRFQLGDNRGFHQRLEFVGSFDSVNIALQYLQYRSQEIGEGGFVVSVTDGDPSFAVAGSSTSCRTSHFSFEVSIKFGNFDFLRWSLPIDGFVETDTKGEWTVQQVEIDGHVDFMPVSSLPMIEVCISAELGIMYSSLLTDCGQNSKCCFIESYANVNDILHHKISYSCTNIDCAEVSDVLIFEARQISTNLFARASLPVKLNISKTKEISITSPQSEVTIQMCSATSLSSFYLTSSGYSERDLFTLEISTTSNGRVDVSNLNGFWIEEAINYAENCKITNMVLIHGPLQAFIDSITSDDFIRYTSFEPVLEDLIYFSLREFSSRYNIENTVVSSFSIKLKKMATVLCPFVRISEPRFTVLEGNPLMLSGIELVAQCSHCTSLKFHNDLYYSLEISYIGGKILSGSHSIEYNIKVEDTGLNTIQLYGQLQSVNVFLSTMVFEPEEDFNGISKITFSNVLSSNCIENSSRSVRSVIYVVVEAVNSPPTFTIPDNDHLILYEDEPCYPFKSIQLYDPDEKSHHNGIYSFQISVSSGSILMQLQHRNGAISSASVQSQKYEGSITVLQRILGEIPFIPENNFFGTVAVHCIFDDRGNFGLGGPLKQETTFELIVLPVNDVPVIHLPSSTHVTQCDENNSAVAMRLRDLFHVDDIDAEHSGLMKLSISVTFGNIEFLSSESVKIERHSPDGVVTATAIYGSFGIVQRVASEAVYKCLCNDERKHEEIRIVATDDFGASTSTSCTVIVPSIVPKVLLRSSENISNYSSELMSGREDEPYPIGIYHCIEMVYVHEDRMSEQFKKSQSITLSAAVEDGLIYMNRNLKNVHTITANGDVSSSDRNKNITIRGSIYSLNDALREIIYLSNDNSYGADTLQLIAYSDTGHSSHLSVNFEIQPVDDPPIIQGPSDFEDVLHDNSNGMYVVKLSGTNLSDPDKFNQASVSIFCMDCLLSVDVRIPQHFKKHMYIEGIIPELNLALHEILVSGYITESTQPKVIITAHSMNGLSSEVTIPIKVEHSKFCCPHIKPRLSSSNQLETTSEEQPIQIGKGLTFQHFEPINSFPRKLYDVSVSYSYESLIEIQRIEIHSNKLPTVHTLVVFALLGEFRLILNEPTCDANCPLRTSNFIPYDSKEHEVYAEFLNVVSERYLVKHVSVRRSEVSLGFKWEISYHSLNEYPILSVFSETSMFKNGVRPIVYYYSKKEKVGLYITFNQADCMENGTIKYFESSFSYVSHTFEESEAHVGSLRQIRSTRITPVMSAANFASALEKLPGVDSVFVERETKESSILYTVAFLSVVKGRLPPVSVCFNSAFFDEDAVQINVVQKRKGTPEVWQLVLMMTQSIQYNLIVDLDRIADNTFEFEMNFNNTLYTFESSILVDAAKLFVEKMTIGDSKQKSTSYFPYIVDLLNGDNDCLLKSDSFSYELDQRFLSANKIEVNLTINEFPACAEAPTISSRNSLIANISMNVGVNSMNCFLNFGVKVRDMSTIWSSAIQWNAEEHEVKSLLSELLEQCRLSSNNIEIHRTNGTDRRILRIVLLNHLEKGIEFFIRPDVSSESGECFNAFSFGKVRESVLSIDETLQGLKLEHISDLNIMTEKTPFEVLLRGRGNHIEASLQALVFSPPSHQDGIVAFKFNVLKESIFLSDRVYNSTPFTLNRSFSIDPVNSKPFLKICSGDTYYDPGKLILFVLEDTPTPLRSLCHNLEDMNTASLQVADMDEGVMGLTAAFKTNDGSFILKNETISELHGSSLFLNSILEELYYVPNQDFHGLSSFTLSVADDRGGQATTIVYLDITAQNDDVESHWNGDTMWIYDTLEEKLIFGYYVTHMQSERAIRPLEGLTFLDKDCSTSDSDTCNFKIDITCFECEYSLRDLQSIQISNEKPVSTKKMFGYGTLEELNRLLTNLAFVYPLGWIGIDVATVVLHDFFSNEYRQSMQNYTYTMIIESFPKNKAPIVAVPALVEAIEDELLIIVPNYKCSDCKDFRSEINILPPYLFSSRFQHFNASSSEDDATILVDIHVVQGRVSIAKSDADVRFVMPTSFNAFSKHISINGSYDEMNAAISNLHYIGPPNGNFMLCSYDTITVMATNTFGSSEKKEIKVYIEPRNDPPVVFFSDSDPYQSHSIYVVEDEVAKLPVLLVDDADEDIQSPSLRRESRLSHTAFTYKLTVTAERGLVAVESDRNNIGIIAFRQTWSLNTTLEEIGGILSSVLYFGGENVYGNDTVHVTLSDGHCVMEKELRNSCGYTSVLVHILSEPDRPSIDIAAEISIDEDTSLLLPSVDFIEYDSGSAGCNGNVSLTIGSDEGTLTFTSTAKGILFLDPYRIGTSTRNVSFLVHPHNVSAVLSSIVYRPPVHFNGYDYIRIRASNNHRTIGGIEPIAVYAEVKTVVTVLPVNDRPIIVKSLHETVSILEDHRLLLDMFTVYDPDFIYSKPTFESNNDLMKIQIKCKHCQLSFVDSSVLSKIHIDINESEIFERETFCWVSTLTFHVKYVNTNTTLSKVQYSPVPDWNGNDTVKLTVHDNKCCGIGGDLVDVAVIELNVLPVNDPPVCHFPMFPLLSSNRVAGIIGPFTVEDLDQEDILTVKISANVGSLFFENPFAVGMVEFLSDRSLNICGNQTAVNGILSKIRFTFSNSDLFPSQYGNELDIFEPFRIVVEVIDEYGERDQCMQSVAYDSSRFVENVMVNVPGAQRVEPPCLSVKDVPTDNQCYHIYHVEPLEVNEDLPLEISDISLSSYDGAAIDHLVVELTFCTSHGTLVFKSRSLIQYTEQTESDGSFKATLFGTSRAINAAIRTVRYNPVPNFFGNDSIIITAMLRSGSATEVTMPLFVLPTPDPPMIRIYKAVTVAGNEDEYIWLPSMAVIDSDNDFSQHDASTVPDSNFNVTISLASGSISLHFHTNLSFVYPDTVDYSSDVAAESSSSGMYIGGPCAISLWKHIRFSGNLSSLNFALASILYKPMENFHGTDVLTVEVLDEGGMSSTSSLTILIRAVDDRPFIEGPSIFEHAVSGSSSLNKQYIAEDSKLSLRSLNLLIRDIDFYECFQCNYDLHVSTQNGRIAFNESIFGVDVFNEMENDDTSAVSLVFRGDLESLQASLDSAVFIPTLNYNGENAGVKISLKPRDDSREKWDPYHLFIPITVYAVDDLPSVILPKVSFHGAHYIGDEDSCILLNGLTIAEVIEETGVGSMYSDELTELLSIDTENGEHLDVKFHRLSAANPMWLTNIGENIFFSAERFGYGRELFMTDGETNPELLADLFPGSFSSNPEHLTQYRGSVYFAAKGIDCNWSLDYPDDCNGFRVAQFNSNVAFFVSQSSEWDPVRFYDCPVGYHWATTEEGKMIFTSALSEVLTMHGSINFAVYYNQCGWDGYLFNGVRREQFRFQDSSKTGAYKAAGKNENSPMDFSFDTSGFAGIVCIRDSNVYEDRLGKTLWKTDGTRWGTIKLESYHSILSPSHMVEFNGRLFFSAFNAAYGIELHSTDGSVSGSVLEADVVSGVKSSNPMHLTSGRISSNEILFFSASNNEKGRELWILTVLGRVKELAVVDLNAGGASSDPVYLTFHHQLGKLFFSANDGVKGRELFCSDGTPSGTKLLSDIAVGSKSSNPAELTVYKDMLVFSADDGSTGRELYIFDGHSTFLLRDIAEGSASSSPRNFIPSKYDQLLYFIASDEKIKHGQRGVQSSIYITDGTGQGTKRYSKRRSPYTFSDFTGLLFDSPEGAAMYRGKSVDNILLFSSIYSINGKPRWPSQSSLLEYNESFALFIHDTEDDGVSVDLSCQSCTIFVGQTHFQAEQTGNVIQLRGKASEVNEAMKNITFCGSENVNGLISIELTVDDVALTSVNVFLRPLNDPPVVLVPERLLLASDVSRIVVRSVEVADADIAETSRITGGTRIEASVWVRLSVTHGRLSLVKVEGLSFRRGFGYSDSELEVVGELRHVNQALQTLEYSCDERCRREARGSECIRIEAEDNGYTGRGGPKRGSAGVERFYN